MVQVGKDIYTYDFSGQRGDYNNIKSVFKHISNVDQGEISVTTKAPPGGPGLEYASLTNYEDSHVFLSGGIPAGCMYCPDGHVHMYDIEQNSWQ